MNIKPRDNGQGPGRKVRIRVDGYTRVCLTLLCILLTVLVVGLWREVAPDPVGEAHAAEPFLNSSAQRKQLLEAQKETNAKLGEILTFLKSGKLKVETTAKEGAHAPSDPSDSDARPSRDR